MVKSAARDAISSRAPGSRNAIVSSCRRGILQQLDGLVYQCDYIARTDNAGLADGGVETAQAPAGRSRIASLDGFVVNLRLDARAEDAESVAGGSHFGEFNQGFANPVALACAHLAAIYAGDGEVLAQSSGIDGEAFGSQFVKGFG